jgi:hypothetical protein
MTRWSLLSSWFRGIYSDVTLPYLTLSSWVLILKELRNLLPSFMFILSITLPNLSIPDVPFPALLLTLIKRRFQFKPATLLIPIDLDLFLLVKELYGTQYQSGSFSLINVGSGFSLPALFFLAGNYIPMFGLKKQHIANAPTENILAASSSTALAGGYSCVTPYPYLTLGTRRAVWLDRTIFPAKAVFKQLYSDVFDLVPPELLRSQVRISSFSTSAGYRQGAEHLELV